MNLQLVNLLPLKFILFNVHLVKVQSTKMVLLNSLPRGLHLSNVQFLYNPLLPANVVLDRFTCLNVQVSKHES